MAPIPVPDGTLTAEMPDGSVVENKLTVGASYARLVGVEHNIINNNDNPYSFIEIEQAGEVFQIRLRKRGS